MAEEFKVLLGIDLKSGELDNIRTQINSIQTNPITLTIDRNIYNQISDIRRQIQDLSNIRINLGSGNGSIGTGDAGRGVRRTVNEVTDAYNDLRNLARRINSIRIQIGGLDASKNSNQIAELSGQLNRLMTDYNNLYNTFTRGFDMPQLAALEDQINRVDTELIRLREAQILASNQGIDTSQTQASIQALETRLNSLLDIYHRLSNGLSIDQINNLTNMFQTATDRVSTLGAKFEDARANLASKIIIDLGTNEFNDQVRTLESNLNKLSIRNNDVVTSVNSVRSALNDMQLAITNNDMDALISSYERYKVALQNASNQISILATNEREANVANKLVQDRTALSNKMSIWLSDNSAAAKQFGDRIQQLQIELQNCDSVRFSGIKREFEQIKQEAILAGKNVKTFGDRLKDSFSKLSTYFSAYEIISLASQGIRDMVDNVIEVDTAMTGLYRVTDLTASQYETLYDNMVSSAKEYGSTLVDVINSTSDWVRLGFDENQAVRLSEITAMYQHISDLDYDIAVENLVTAYKGFQDQLMGMYDGDSTAAIEYIADILNELDNNFAVTADDIGAALSKSASALSLAGNTIQETAAMVTGITEVTQDPEKAGSALKILSLRLRGMKGQLQELGEEVDSNVESISKMQTQILNLTDGEVNIFNEDGSFKSTFEIMDKIADVYDRLDPTKQADLLETIAGKYFARMYRNVHKEYI